MQTLAHFVPAHVPAQRRHLDPPLGGRSRRCPLLNAVAQPADRLEPGLDGRNLEQSPELLTPRVEQHRQPFGVHLAHAPDVTAEMSFTNEVAQDRLVEKWCMSRCD